MFISGHVTRLGNGSCNLCRNKNANNEPHRAHSVGYVALEKLNCTIIASWYWCCRYDRCDRYDRWTAAGEWFPYDRYDR